jgi:hypothetical protein
MLLHLPLDTKMQTDFHYRCSALTDKGNADTVTVSATELIHEGQAEPTWVARGTSPQAVETLRCTRLPIAEAVVLISSSGWRRKTKQVNGCGWQSFTPA